MPTVKGFGVRNQSRVTMRKELTGEYRGYKWAVECIRRGVFEWRVSSQVKGNSFGVLRGFTPPKSELGTALAEIRDATKLMDLVGRYDRYVTQDMADQLNLLHRWTRMALQGRLKIKLKRRRNRAKDVYHTVEETPC
jgi:hypothetical protein